MLTQLWRKLRPQKTNPLAALMFSLLPGLRGKFMGEDIYDSPQAHLTIYKTSMVLTKYSVTGQTSLLVNPHDVAAALSNLVSINTGLLPANTVATGVKAGKAFITVYLPPSARTLSVKTQDTVIKFQLPTPPLVFSAWGKDFKVFAVKNEPSKFSHKTPLFIAPYPNTYDTGGVCGGSANFALANIEQVISAFFESHFSTHLADGKSVSCPKNVIDLWHKIEGQADYPLDDLVPARFQLAEVLKW